LEAYRAKYPKAGVLAEEPRSAVHVLRLQSFFDLSSFATSADRSNPQNNLSNPLAQVGLQNNMDPVAARQQRTSDNHCPSLTEIDTESAAELREICTTWSRLPRHVRTTILALIRAICPTTFAFSN